MHPLNNWVASLESAITGIAAQGNALLLDNTAFIITNECSGLYSSIDLAAIIFALKKPELEKKAALFAAGFLFLFPLNLVRIYAVLLSAKAFGTGVAMLFHIASWFIVSLLVVSFWYYASQKSLGIKHLGEML